MAIDLYALCPCGSGKKIKFCCRDLAAEIEKIERMIDAGQRQACLEHIELLEKKHPNRAYLLARKAELQRELGRGAEADGTLQTLLEQEQENPMALAEAALHALAKEEGPEVPLAIDQLQRALEVSPRDPWPDKVKEALAAVADECFAAGYLPACLAHTVLFLEAEPESEGAMRALAQFGESAQVPLLLKELRSFLACPEDAHWRDDFNAALAVASRGFWRLGEWKLTRLVEGEHSASGGRQPPDDADSPRAPDQGADAPRSPADSRSPAESCPAVWHNLALLRMWLGEEPEAVAALQKLAAMDIPVEDAAEAMALALTIDPSPVVERGDVLRVAYPIRDMERVIAAVKTNRHYVDYTSEIERADDQPPPRSAHLVLDREELAQGAELSPETLPLVTGYMMVYGRETDREARLEYLVPRDDDLAANTAKLAATFGDALGPPGEKEDVAGERLVSPLWESKEYWLPRNTPIDTLTDVRWQRQRRFLAEEWPKQPRKFLDGKTPEQAAAEPLGRIKLLGLLLYVELGGQRQRATSFDFNELRRQLGLPEAGSIDPAGASISDVPLARLARLQMDKLSDEDLLRAFSRAAHYRAAAAAQKAALELVSRTNLDGKIDKAAIYTTLAYLTQDTRQALEFVEHARRIAENAGQSSAAYDIHELTLRVRRGEGQDFTRLMDHLVAEHIDEPGVRQALRNILGSLGMINPDGSVPSHLEPEAAAAAAEESRAAETPSLWTPDSPQPATGGEKPRILLPS
jgi:tetratricopeptide (TPR) repeat protein